MGNIKMTFSKRNGDSLKRISDNTFEDENGKIITIRTEPNGQKLSYGFVRHLGKGKDDDDVMVEISGNGIRRLLDDDRDTIYYYVRTWSSRDNKMPLSIAMHNLTTGIKVIVWKSSTPMVVLEDELDEDEIEVLITAKEFKEYSKRLNRGQNGLKGI